MSDTFNPGDRVQGRRSGRLGTVSGDPFPTDYGTSVPVRWDEEPDRVACMYPDVLYRLPARAPALDRTKVQEAYRVLGQALDASIDGRHVLCRCCLIEAQTLLEEADA